MNVIEKLLAAYSIEELIFLVIALGLTVKSLISFYDWIADRVRKMLNKQSKQEQEKQAILDRLDAQTEIIKTLSDSVKTISNENHALRNKLDILFESDKDSIRAWITQQHHRFMALGYIDDYSLDCLERRFTHYQEEGGNSYIEDLMKDLRSLRKVAVPPMPQSTK